MINIDVKSNTPIYYQIVEELKNLIISGVLEADERLPSVRDLAQTLTINPNTIQKAYKELESQGYIYTASSRGKFVSDVESAMDKKKREDLISEFNKISKELKYIGVNREELDEELENIFSEGEK